jgi:hypothetical protein
VLHRGSLPKEGWQVLRGLGGLLAKYNAVLAGGTALALHLGHRVSVDLDFFTGADFRNDEVLAGLRQTGLPFRLLSEGDGFLILEVGGVKTSLFRYGYPFIEKPLISGGVRISGLLDVASMKIIAISLRGTKRDFVDLYFILQEVPFHKIAGHTVARFGPERINAVHIGKSLIYFSDAESHPEPEYVKGRKVPWTEVKDFFRRHVKQFTLDLDVAVKGASRKSEK